MNAPMTAADVDAQAELEIAAFEAGETAAAAAAATTTVQPDAPEPQAAQPADTQQPNTATQASNTEQKPEGAQLQGEQQQGEQPATEQTKPEDLQALAEIAQGNAKPADPLQLLQFRGEAPQDYKSQRAALMSEKAQAMKKLMEGEIDPDAHAAIEADVLDKLEDLTAARIRAETLASATAQVQEISQQQVINNLVAKAKAAGEVDYAADATARVQWDAALSALQADPGNAQKPFAELADMAHKTVALLRGVAKPQQTPPSQTATQQAAAPKPAPTRTPPETPVTLSGLPNAGSAGEQTVDAVLSNLTGPEFEAAFDALPDAKKQQFFKQR